MTAPPIGLGQLLAEIRYAFRTLSRSPVYTVTAVFTLALGIGANALVGSFAVALFLRPLPFDRAHELVGISTTHRASNGEIVDFLPSAQDLVAYDSRSRTLALIGGMDSQGFALIAPDGPQAVQGATMTASLWEVFGTKPAAGRTFTAAEDLPGATVIVISATLQQRLFRGPAEGAIGRAITIDGQIRTVIGVMPPGYQPRLNRGDVWMPMGVNPSTATAAQKMQIVARLRPGVSIETARVDLSRIAAELAVELPANHRDWGVSVMDLREKVGDSARGGVTLTLLAAVTFLLLLTCANLTNLALIRASNRQGDISTRFALGASTSSIARHQFFEALIVSVAGGLIGTAGAAVGLRAALALLTTDNQIIPTVSLDGRVLGAVAILSLVVGVVCSILPGLKSLKGALHSALAGGGRRAQAGVREQRTRRLLMTLQVGAASILLVGSLNAVITLQAVGTADPGFHAADVYVGPVTLSSSRYPNLLERGVFVDQVVGRLRESPEIEKASMVTNRFVSGQSVQTMVTIDGLPNPEPVATELRRIDSDYFHTLGIPLLQGRTFGPGDREGSEPVVIVNRTLVRQYLGGKDPLAARIKRRTGGWITVVGVVPDVRDSGAGVDVGPMVYLPFAQVASPSPSFLVKSRLPQNEVERVIRGAVAAVDPGQPVETVLPMPQLLHESLGESRFKAITLALLSALAVLVASLGIYGVTAYVIAERTKEVAVRMTLGAVPTIILRHFVVDSGRFVLGGAAGGLVLSFAIGHTLARFAPEVATAGVVTYIVTGVLLAAVGLVATLIPTVRALRIHPASVLRS